MNSIHAGIVVLDLQVLAKLLQLPEDCKIITVFDEPGMNDNSISVKVVGLSMPEVPYGGRIPRIDWEPK